MGKQANYVIIGNGIAGITAAEILRAEDATCSLTIIADDPFPAYYRPALKDYLGGKLPEERLWARPSTFYRDQRIRFLPGRVIGLNGALHTIHLQNGQQISYDKLLLANGARPRTLRCPGMNLAGVSTLRTVADYQQILRRLPEVQRIVVYGSGTLALESAETLNHSGYQVTHIMRGHTLWSEVLDTTASDLVLHEEQRDGIEVRTGEEIIEILGENGQVLKVVTTSGARIPCELVLIAIGIEPLIDFIRASGITCGRGVKVDNGMRTNIADIYAAGDVIETTDELTGRTRVLGQWFPAIQQAQIAAYNMLGKFPPGHPFYPGTRHEARSAYQHYYNATFLYGLDFVSIGLTTAPNQQYQEILAEPQPRNYRKVILYNGIIVGALLLGNRKNALAFKRAIDHRVNLSSVAHRLFADDFDLNSWLDERQVPPAILNVHKEGVPELSSSSKLRTFEAPTLFTEAVSLKDLTGNADAFLVPIPHPKVQVSLQEIQLPASQQPFTLGRQAGVNLLIDHSSVSRLHAQIACVDGEYLLRDLGSRNGTFVNGKQPGSGTEHPLRHHDRVRFGDVQFRLELRPREIKHAALAHDLTDNDFSHIQETELHTSVTRIVPNSVLRSMPETPALVLVGKDTQPEIVPLEQNRRYTLGRDRDNSIVLKDPSASRKHAELFSAPDGFYIRDLGSRYGVFVNKVKIQNAFHLNHGDRVVLGNMLVYFSYPQMQRASGVYKTAAQNGATTRVLELAKTTQALGTSGKLTSATTQQNTVAGLSHRKAIQGLNEERTRFEIDMCIGCDRCMDACPVPMSSLVTIADLNMATVTTNVSPNVARFTHECIMCGSCVPVCPVDNHRDLLMLTLKQRLGVSWNNPPQDLSNITKGLPTGWTLPLVLGCMREQSFLGDANQVPDNYLLHIAASSSLHVFMPGDILIREGTYGRDLYLLLGGRLELFATDANDKEILVGILQRGEHVGEDGMLTGLPYKTTARAQANSLVLRIPEQVMQRLMELVPGVRAHFETYNQARSLKSILRRLYLFQGVADSDLDWLIRQTLVKEYDRSTRLFAEDDQGGRPARETLHIILEGFVKVSRRTLEGTGQHKSNERIIAYRQGGDYFAGGLDLLGDEQAVTVTTINRCRVAEVPRNAIQMLFQRYTEMQERFTERLHEYVETAVSAQGFTRISGPLQHFASTVQLADPHVQEGLHSLVSDGVVEGTEVLVIDLDKCIHCNECEEACERRHGHSRMNRKGMVVGNISIATACRQCQDPVCMLCTRAGIARHPNGEVYITESCIGCGICAERCPYGAISIVNVEDDAPARSSWQRFSEFFTKGSGREQARKTLPVLSATGGKYAAPGPLESTTRGGYEELRKKIAIKCDLCAGYSDQACVQACPMGAAVRVQPVKFFGSTEEILRKRLN